jgi:hypothetical protein
MSSASKKGSEPSKSHKSSKSKASASADAAEAAQAIEEAGGVNLVHASNRWGWKMLDKTRALDLSDSSDDDRTSLTDMDLMEDIVSKPKPKLTLTRTRRLQNLATGRDHSSGFITKLLQKLVRGFDASERTSERQSLRVSKLTKDVEHKYLTLTHVNVVRRIETDSLDPSDKIEHLYFTLLDKMFQVELTSTSAFCHSSCQRRVYECATRVFMVDRSKSIRDKGHLICSLANIIEFNTSVVGHKSCRTLVPGDSKRRMYDNSLIGEEYRVRENTVDAKNKESENIMTALMSANDHNTLELVSPVPADLGYILNVLVVRWRNFKAGDKHPVLVSRRSRLEGGSRRSSKRRKSRTMKKRK